MNKVFHRVSEFYDSVKDLREHGVSKGVDVGFACLKDLYSLKNGGTTYIYSAPYSGKSMWVWEMCLNLAIKLGYITAVFSPESGTKEEIVAELVFKMTGKELYKTHANSIDDELLKQVLTFINDHFIIIDTDVKYNGEEDLLEQYILTINAFFDGVTQAEKFYGKKINLTVVDPFNELGIKWGKDRDLDLEKLLGLFRLDAVKHDRHNIVVTHVAQQKPDIINGKSFYPPASPREIAGGQAWFRKAMMMISMWRPPEGIQGEDGRLYEENEMHLIVQKAKPRYCGMKGTAILYYDKEIGRYYEKINGRKYYAFQYDKYSTNLLKEGKILIN